MSLEYLVVPERKKVLKKQRGGPRKRAQEPTCKSFQSSSFSNKTMVSNYNSNPQDRIHTHDIYYITHIHAFIIYYIFYKIKFVTSMIKITK